MDRSIIDQYAAGADLPAQASAGLTPAQLDATPVPGTWTIRQIIAHLMDSDLIGSDRMKRVAAEEQPQLIAYDETAFASQLGYEHMDVAAACQVFALNRRLTADLLRRLPDAAYARTGLHSERGLETLAELVHGYVEHLDGHLKHLHHKRGLLGA